MKIDFEQLDAIFRRDFYSFLLRSFVEMNPATEVAENWHIEVMAQELERCRQGEIKRLIVNLPPRSLKSHCASVALPAWILGHHPSAQIICASYAQDLADKHAIDCRALMNSAFYQRLFPATRLSSEKRAVADFLTTARGCRKATSVGGVLTGRGADFIIIDDPLQPDKALSDTRRNACNDWYDNTLVSRLNHKLTGCILIVMQRLHEDDLVGHVLDIERREEQERQRRLKEQVRIKDERVREGYDFSRAVESSNSGGSISGRSVSGGSPLLQQGEAGLQSSGSELSLSSSFGASVPDPSAKAQENNNEDVLSNSAEALPPHECGGSHLYESQHGLAKWNVVRFSAIAEEDEHYEVHRFAKAFVCGRHKGEILHPEREPREILDQLRETLGEYHFAGQYQQSPAPLGGGIVKPAWFKTYTESELPKQFDFIFQSWDTANKATELSDYSVCTTWGVLKPRDGEGSSMSWGIGRVYLLHVLRLRLDYPELKRIVREQAALWCAKNVLIEDKASGTQLCQELIQEGMHFIQKCQPKQDKVMRMHTVTSTIKNGFVYLPEKAPWLAQYVHELATFPNGKHDDQADSTSQALDWMKSFLFEPGIVEYYRKEAEKLKAMEGEPGKPPRLTREWYYRTHGMR